MNKDEFSSMTCEQIKNIWSSEPEVLGILDLRTSQEFVEKHIPGSKNVPLSELRVEVANLEDRLAVLICPEEKVQEAKDLLDGKSNYVFMSGCERWFQTLSAPNCEGIDSKRSICVHNHNEVPEVHIDEVLKTLGQVKLIDVRRPDEFNNELGHIQGAQMLTLGPELTQKLKNIKDKNEEIIFVCRSGGRSESATKEALSLGFKRVANMVGGMLLWNEKKYPIFKD